MADARRLPFADESFTATLCTSVMTYVDTPAAVVAELWRVTKPHGRIVLGYLDVLGDLDSGPNTRRLSLHTALGRYKIVVIDKNNNNQSCRH
nr:hypothetical protein [Kibdelosporangium sp. MJ126-NF4]